MARAIDGELLELEIANIANKLAKSDAQKALMGRVMYCVEHMPTLIPTNEPEYREYTCPYCYHTWLEDRDASDYPNYCPVCRAVLRDGSAPPNEPLTLEELREMGGQPYWHVGLREESPPPHWNILDPFYAKHIEDYKYGENWLAYRHPQEGEEDK